MRVMVTEINNRYQPIGDKAVFHMANIPTNFPNNPLAAAALKAACVTNEHHEVTLMRREGRQLLATARYPTDKLSEALHGDNAPRVFLIVTGYKDGDPLLDWAKLIAKCMANA